MSSTNYSVFSRLEKVLAHVSNSPRTTILQVLLLATTYSLYWGYQLLAKPVQLSKPLLLQNLLLFGSAGTLVMSIVVQVTVSKKFVINRQYLAWSLLVVLALLSLSWARDPVAGFQSLKFHIFMITTGLMSINYMITSKLRCFWIYYFLLFSLGTLLLGVTLGINYGSLRNVPFGGNLNTIYVITCFTAIPVAVHFYYHSQSRVLKMLAATIFCMGTVTLVLSESRVSFVFVMVVVSGLLLFDHDYLVGWSHSRIAAAVVTILGVTGLCFILALDPDMLGRVYTVTAEQVSSLTGPLEAEDPVRVQIYKFTAYLLGDIQTYISGTGYHNFGVEFESFSSVGQRNPHNAFLKPLLEMGIVGFCLFAMVVIYPLRYGLAAAYLLTETSDRSLAVGLLWSYVGVLVFAMFQPIAGSPHIHLISVLLFGTLTATSDQAD